MFEKIKAQHPDLPLIAEDLGTIDQPVYDLRDQFGIAGMKVIQFAFEGDHSNIFLPFYHVKNSVVYTGTHDNSTIKGWYAQLNEKGKDHLEKFLAKPIHEESIHDELVRVVLYSVADIAILPLQDLIGLGDEAIVNKPNTTEGNWTWRMQEDMLTPEFG